MRDRRAMMILASAGGNRVPVIARLVQADGDTVRDAIHRFDAVGLTCSGPQGAGGRPRPLGPDDGDFVIRRPPPARSNSADSSPVGPSASSPPTCAAARPG